MGQVALEEGYPRHLSDFDGVLERGVLVHVDRLDSFTPREDHGVVLVVGLTFSHQDLPGELRAIRPKASS